MDQDILRYACERELHGLRVSVTQGTAYIAYVCAGGAGFSVCAVSAGNSWTEGPDEMIAVCDSEADAASAIDRYADGLRSH